MAKNNHACMFGWYEHKFTSNKMQKAAEAKGIDSDIFAVSASDADNNLANKDVDVLLLGPQVRFMKADFEKRLEPKGIPLDVINMADYGMMNGEKC